MGTDSVQTAATVYESGIQLTSQRTGVIPLLYKKGDRTNLGWRPLILLNTDYKIIARALANRLESVMGAIVHPD